MGFPEGVWSGKWIAATLPTDDYPVVSARSRTRVPPDRSGLCRTPCDRQARPASSSPRTEQRIAPSRHGKAEVCEALHRHITKGLASGALKAILDRIFKFVSTGGTTSLPSVSPADGHRKMSALKAISTDMTLPQAVSRGSNRQPICRKFYAYKGLEWQTVNWLGMFARHIRSIAAVRCLRSGLS
jgi:hypothetical protein